MFRSFIYNFIFIFFCRTFWKPISQKWYSGGKHKSHWWKANYNRLIIPVNKLQSWHTYEIALDHTSWVFFSLTHIRENTKHTHIRYITFPIEYVHIKQYLQCTQEKLGISYLNFYVQKILWWFTDVIPIRYFLFYHFSVNRVFANV